MLRLTGGVRLRSRTVKMLVVLGATVALASIVVGSASASASFPAPNGAHGWYITPSLFGRVNFDLTVHEGIKPLPLSFPPGAVSCRVPGGEGPPPDDIVGLFFGTRLATFNPVEVQVELDRDSASPNGTVVTCKGTLLEETQFCFFGFCTYTGDYEEAGEVTKQVTLHIDNSRPVSVSFAPSANPNALGWYNAPATVAVHGFDPNSGIDFCDSGSPFGPGLAGQSIGPPDGVAKTIVGGCMNMAGLPSGFSGNPATEPGTFQYKYDATLPTVAVTGVTDGAVYANGSVPAAGCSTSDNLSGVATHATLSLSDGPLGAVTATCSGGKDKAGNAAAPFSVSYSVGTPLTTKTQAMSGDLKVAQGSTLSAGYDFTMAGKHPSATVGFLATTVTFNATCASGTPGSQTIVVNIDDQGYVDPENSSAWYPSGDQKDASTYQGAATVPSFCDPGALVRLQQGGTFSTYVTSTDTQDKVNVRWHYMDEKGGGWSGTYSVIPS